MIAGDLVLNGPDPAAAIDADPRARGRRRPGHPGQHRHRRRRLRLRSGLPVDDRRDPRRDPGRRRSGPTRRSGRTGSTGCAGSRPSAGSASTRRSPWSATPRPARRPRASTRPSTRTSLLERASGTDARIIACGHTHLPEVRDLGWRVIVNSGSAGYVFDGDPTASWALIDIDGDEVRAEIQRADLRRVGRRERDLGPGAARATSTGPRRSGPGSSSDERRACRWPAAPRRVVVTGMGAVTALGTDVASTWDGLTAGRSGIRTITSFDPSRVDLADRRRGPRLRRQPRPRPQGPAPDRSLHPVRAGRRPRGARPGRPARAAGGRPRRADRGVHRIRPRRHEHDVLERPAHGRARARPDQPVLHPDVDPQRVRRPGRHRLRPDRSEHGHRVGLRHRRSCHRRGLGDDPPGRRRRDDRGRGRGGHPRGVGRRVQLDEGALDPERRPDRPPRDPSTAVATGSSSARAGRPSSSRRSTTPSPAERPPWPSSSGMAPPPTRRISRCRRRAASAPCGQPGSPSPRPVSRRTRSTT